MTWNIFFFLVPRGSHYRAACTKIACMWWVLNMESQSAYLGHQHRVCGDSFICHEHCSVKRHHLWAEVGCIELCICTLMALPRESAILADFKQSWLLLFSIEFHMRSYSSIALYVVFISLYIIATLKELYIYYIYMQLTHSV